MIVFAILTCSAVFALPRKANSKVRYPRAWHLGLPEYVSPVLPLQGDGTGTVGMFAGGSVDRTGDAGKHYVSYRSPMGRWSGSKVPLHLSGLSISKVNSMKMMLLSSAPKRWRTCRNALSKKEVFLMTASDVRGCGRQRGYTKTTAAAKVFVRLLSKVKTRNRRQ